MVGCILSDFLFSLLCKIGNMDLPQKRKTPVKVPDEERAKLKIRERIKLKKPVSDSMRSHEGKASDRKLLVGKR